MTLEEYSARAAIAQYAIGDQVPDVYKMDVRDYLRMVHRERRSKLARRMALTAARFILVLLVSFILWFGLRRG